MDFPSPDDLPEMIPTLEPPTTQAAIELERMADKLRHCLSVIALHKAQGTYSPAEATRRGLNCIEQFFNDFFDGTPPGFIHEKRQAEQFERWCGRNGIDPYDEMHGKAEEMQQEFFGHLEQAGEIQRWWSDYRWTFRSVLLSYAAEHSPAVMAYLLNEHQEDS